MKTTAKLLASIAFLSVRSSDAMVTCNSTSSCAGSQLNVANQTTIHCQDASSCAAASIVGGVGVSVICAAEDACTSLDVLVNPGSIACEAGACDHLLVYGGNATANDLTDEFVITCTDAAACSNAQLSVQQVGDNAGPLLSVIVVPCSSLTNSVFIVVVVGLCCLGEGACTNVQVASHFTVCCQVRQLFCSNASGDFASSRDVMAVFLLLCFLRKEAVRVSTQPLGCVCCTIVTVLSSLASRVARFRGTALGLAP